MIEVNIDSVRVSLMSQSRVIVLKESDSERYLPIWIGPNEADAITIQLQGVEVARPLTHDLLRNVIETLGAKVSHVVVTDLQNDTFFARVLLDVEGRAVEVDSRPSDAIALAVRVKVPIFVEDDVMEKAGILPEEDMALGESPAANLTDEQRGKRKEDEPAEEDLEVFRDFIDGLDLEGLGGSGSDE